jgi:hypothetical protein
MRLARLRGELDASTYARALQRLSREELLDPSETRAN